MKRLFGGNFDLIAAFAIGCFTGFATVLIIIGMALV